MSSDEQKLFDILAGYDGLEGVDVLYQEKSDDHFNELKQLCLDKGITDGDNFDDFLYPMLDRYMESRYANFLQYARKSNGTFKYRRFQLPIEQARNLENESFEFKTKTKRVRGVDITVCEVRGVPDGFYSAWKTLTRAMDNNITLTPDLGKSAIDAELRRLKRAENAERTAEYNPITALEEAKSGVLTAIARFPISTQALLEDRNRRITQLIAELYSFTRMREHQDETTITVTGPEAEVGSGTSEGSQPGASN